GKRGSSKAAIEATMSSKGILGILTSTSNVSKGREVADILGKSNQTSRDLDKALSNLSGITTSGVVRKGEQGYGYNNANVKGGRFGDNSDIDDLVSGLGKTKSNSIKRSGDLVVVSESPLVESSSRKGIVGRDQDDVQAIVVKHNSSIQYCYERELKRNPNLKGKLVIRFTITPRGTIKKVEIVSSTLNNRKVEQCVISRIRRWTDFGAIASSYGDTTIRQVYAFGY
ncbi:MAG: AgmX/PglI C-terminal domain-containing protein, partial [bacterium]